MYDKVLILRSVAGSGALCETDRRNWGTPGTNWGATRAFVHSVRSCVRAFVRSWRSCVRHV